MDNYIIKPLPRTDRNGMAIRTDYKAWIAFHTALENPLNLIGDTERYCVDLIYRDEPADYESAFLELIEFDRMYNYTEYSSSNNENPVFDWAQDWDKVYAAFMRTYNIDIIDCEYMHWWKFKALMNDLLDDTTLRNAIHYRSLDVGKEKDKERKNHIIKMKKLYELR